MEGSRKQPAVYIVTNKPNGTLYIGVTSQLIQRIHQHKQHLVPGFSNRYHTTVLVHYELYDDMYQAIQREKNLKHWVRQWKIELIESTNPDWRDLWEDLVG